MSNQLYQEDSFMKTSSIVASNDNDEDLTPTMELDSSSLMPAPAEEPPYFPEKFPGKVCVLCNLGERSQLGQGEMLRLEANNLDKSDSSSALSDDPNKTANPESISPRSLAAAPQFANKRQKGLNKCKNPVNTTEYVDDLDKIGYCEIVEFSMVVDAGYYYIHRNCAMWSFGVVKEPNDTLSNVLPVVQQNLAKKCTYCSRFGASVACKMSCPNSFHYPCLAASGGFQIIQSCTSFCKEHLGQVPLVCSDDINCRTCAGLGDVGNLIMCSRCGDHYHGLCIGVPQLPGVRAGWQCTSCRMCQICRIPDSIEGRTIACEQCDKIYHANCLRPVMTSIPKYGWKCRGCRVCSDCGARTPGAGASSRWHSHFTICDSCYQQRNKGFSCPICRRAYRAAAYREMVKCFQCQKFVHSGCDPDADPDTYHSRKESNSDYEYICTLCKTNAQNERIAAIRRNSSIDEDSLSASQESLNTIEDMEVDEVKTNELGLGKGKPFVATKIAKKRLNITQKVKTGSGKLGFQKRTRLADFGRKRGPKTKMLGVFGVPGVGLQRPSADSSKNNSEEEPGGENRLVLCSSKDKFVLTQDICVMCGAIGTDQEGCLISCAQCGQCYHPYCVSVKVTKVILQKGWRCLDCTVCEGCGQKNDEARLILCDDCDISYHIYCMDPPLDNVPHGTWKCKWCAICQKCGANDPGANSNWMNSYTECGPCASQSNCSVCQESYSDGELIISCTQCDRWLHGACDSIRSETEAEKCADENYICILCRPKDTPPPHMLVKKAAPAIVQPQVSQKDDMYDEIDFAVAPLALEGNHLIDGVFLSEHGLHHIKSLHQEPKRTKRKPKSNVEIEKDAGILAAIESVVAGSSLDNSLEDIKLEPLDPNEEAQIYKDGMVWSGTDPAPDGFALGTNENGQVVLRKKRQRNLQKLGIGGFSVRNRTGRNAIGKNESEELTTSLVQSQESLAPPTPDEKPKKKPVRRKQKSKLGETYPSYLQEAFFGRPLMDTNVNVKIEMSSSDDESKNNLSNDKLIQLNSEELKLFDAYKLKQQKLLEEQKLAAVPAKAPITNIAVQQTQSGQQIILQGQQVPVNKFAGQQKEPALVKSPQISANPLNQTPQTISTADIKSELDFLNEDANNSDTDAFKDVLGLSGDLLDNDLVNTIMNEENSKNSVLDDIGNTGEINETLSKNVKDELTDILNSPHFNLVDCKDVEEMFKGVLTDESQESQESVLTNSMTPYSSQSTPSHHSEIMSTPNASSTPQPMQMAQQTPPIQQTPLVSPGHMPMMQAQQQQQQQININQQMMSGHANVQPQGVMSGG